MAAVIPTGYAPSPATRPRFIPQVFLKGTAAPGGIAFVSSVGAFGGFVGP